MYNSMSRILNRNINSGGYLYMEPENENLKESHLKIIARQSPAFLTESVCVE